MSYGDPLPCGLEPCRHDPPPTCSRCGEDREYVCEECGSIIAAWCECVKEEA